MSEFQIVLNKLLNGTKLHYPFISDSKTSFRDDLRLRLDNFIGRIDKFTGENKFEIYLKKEKKELSVICDYLVSSLDYYLAGNSGKAYRKIEEVFESKIIKDNLQHLIENMNRWVEPYNYFYRTRISENELSAREEMFHAPFCERFKVGSQRYSIAGLPCLYLGTSIYVCWQEMGRPDLNKLYLSRFSVDINKSLNIKYLNFGYSLETLKHTLNEEFFIDSTDEDNNFEKYKSFLVMFPILLSCSYETEHKNANFNVEYVIPNIVLQLINNKTIDVDGIAYYSTKIKHFRHYNKGINFVFPPDYKNDSKKYCDKLGDKFSLTTPISWQLLDTMNFDVDAPVGSFSGADDMDESFIKNYDKTKFCTAEEKLKKMRLGNIKI